MKLLELLSDCCYSDYCYIYLNLYSYHKHTCKYHHKGTMHTATNMLET